MASSPTPLLQTGSLRALSALLRYPGEALRAALPEIASLLRDDPFPGVDAVGALDELCTELMTGDLLALQADYVSWFDQGRATSLHLFEHVHGDSRDRGPAMIDLVRTYEAAGLYFTANELPDYLPAVLEFGSTLNAESAREFLGELAHLISAIHAALTARGSRYACVLQVVGQLAGTDHDLISAPRSPDQPIDESWEEPPVFGACTSPRSVTHPIHIMRRHPGVSP